MKAKREFGIKGAIWTKRGDWQPTYVYEQQKQAGMAYQHYMYSADGKPLCAGVTQHERMNRAIANQIVRVWDRWRNEYVSRNPGRYPTAEEVTTPVAKIAVFPVGNESQIEWFNLSQQ